MVSMPEPMIVWMVELDLSPDDVEGILTLDETSLRFDRPDAGGGRTIQLTDVTKVKRVIGSPLFLVHSLENEVRRATAFYLSKPPPLHPPAQDDPPQTVMMGRGNKVPSKRRQRRSNATYLTSVSGALGPIAKDWVREIRAAIEAARRTGA
jgi:hypothetical protein